MRKKRQLTLKLVQKNKEYTCEGCGEIFTGIKRKYCTPKCRAELQQEIYRTKIRKWSTTCKECGETITGHKRVFCDKQCLERHKQEELKMGFQNGHRHETPYPIEDYGIPTVSIPANVLQEAKIYVDLHNPRIVEDARKVIRIAFRELYSLKKSLQKEK